MIEFSEALIDTNEISDISALTIILNTLIPKLKHRKNIKVLKIKKFEHHMFGSGILFQYEIQSDYKWYYAIYKYLKGGQ